MGSETSLLEQHAMKPWRDKNYMLCRIPARENKDYFESLIEEMDNYSKRLVFMRNGAEKIPFPILFMLNLLTRFPPFTDPNQVTIALKFKRYLGKYVERYYLEHNKPEDIPLLYSIISMYIADKCRKYGFYGSKNDSMIEADKYHFLGLKYWKKHKENKENLLLKSFETYLEMHNLTMLPKYLLNLTTTSNIDMAFSTKRRAAYKNASYLMKQSFESFVILHSKYSIYDRDCDDYCYAGFAFVCDMTRRMLQHDTPKISSRKYQKRYKCLLKLAIRSMVKYIGNGVELSERYGLYHCYLAFYYAYFSKKKNNLKIARNYVIKGINILRNLREYFQSLSEMYTFLIWVNGGLGMIDECIKVTKMCIDFWMFYNKHTEVVQLEKDLRDFDKIKAMKLNKFIVEEYTKSYWANVLKNRRDMAKITISTIFGGDLSPWIGYFRRDKHYQVLKNIVAMKECNYSKCRAKNVKLQICSKCKSVYYCCKSHQKIDWKMKHRKECKEFATRNANLTLKNTTRRWKMYDHLCPERGPCTRFVDVL